MKKLLSIAFVAALVAPLAIQAEPLAKGADAPDGLKVKTQDGEEIDLSAELDEGVSLVYFYPKAMTGGCTKQACNVRDSKDELAKAGIKVFGVSHDTVEDQKKFADKEDLNFTLLADTEREVIKAFGVPTNPKGFAARHSFLVQDGKVIYHNPKANPVTQSEDAIAALKEHGKS